MVREIALVNWQRGAGWEEENPGGGRTGHFSALQDGIASALALHYSMVSKTFFRFFRFARRKGQAHTHWVTSIPNHGSSLGGVACMCGGVDEAGMNSLFPLRPGVRVIDCLLTG